jgi:hypothetical protein
MRFRILGRQLWGLYKVDSTSDVGFGTKRRWIKKRGEHA